MSNVSRFGICRTLKLENQILRNIYLFSFSTAQSFVSIGFVGCKEIKIHRTLEKSYLVSMMCFRIGMIRGFLGTLVVKM